MTDHYVCTHEDEHVDYFISEGKNIVGKEVRSLMEHIRCRYCHDKSVRFTEPLYPKDEIETAYRA